MPAPSRTATARGRPNRDATVRERAKSRASGVRAGILLVTLALPEIAYGAEVADTPTLSPRLGATGGLPARVLPLRHWQASCQ